MRKPLFTATAGLLILGLTTLAPAQEPRKSPHESTFITVNGHKVTITYGRPYMNKRTIMGGLVPYNEVWRTGADEATLLITQQDIQLGDATIPAGAYTLWTLPNEDGTAKLIINKQVGQWGQDYKDPKKVYDEAKDQARVDLKKDATEKPVDQFTMSVGKNASGGGILKLMWDDTQYSVPYSVKK